MEILHVRKNTPVSLIVISGEAVEKFTVLLGDVGYIVRNVVNVRSIGLSDNKGTVWVKSVYAFNSVIEG